MNIIVTGGAGFIGSNFVCPHWPLLWITRISAS